LKLLLLVNASASSVTARGRVVIQKALAADHDVTLAETNRRGHATRLAQGAATDGTEVVVVLGGDGTLNEAANGLAGGPCALAALPGGSTNVFARTIGLPNDPIEATSVLLDALADGSIRKVGLGSVNGRYFMFHVGVGYDAAVVAQVERRDTLKRYLGHPLFAYSAVSTWFRHYEHDHPRFRVEHVDPPVEPVGSAFTIVLNTNPYTYLGNRPFDAAPEATLDRGLVVLAMRKMTVPNILRLAGRALSKGGPPVGRLRFVDCRTDVTEVTVAGDEPFPYQVDGDHLGDTERLLFRHHPEALLLVVPDSRHIART
jgi:diacylglycerol kinase family enzyme